MYEGAPASLQLLRLGATTFFRFRHLRARRTITLELDSLLTAQVRRAVKAAKFETLRAREDAPPQLCRKVY